MGPVTSCERGFDAAKGDIRHPAQGDAGAGSRRPGRALSLRPRRRLQRPVRRHDRRQRLGPRPRHREGRAAGLRPWPHHRRSAGARCPRHHRRGRAEGPRRRRTAPVRRDDAVQHAGDLPPGRHPPVPSPAPRLAPPPPHRAAAVQRQRRRGGRLGADRAPADGHRRRPHAPHRRDRDPRDRRHGRHRRLPRLPGDRRAQRHLPAASRADRGTGTAVARGGQRGRARELRRRPRRQDPRPRGRRDRAVRRGRRRTARRQRGGRPRARAVRPDPGGAAQPRRARRPARRLDPPARRRHQRRRPRARGVPVHAAGLPDPRARLGARRGAPQRRRLGPRPRRPRRHRRAHLRRPVAGRRRPGAPRGARHPVRLHRRRRPARRGPHRRAGSHHRPGGPHRLGQVHPHEPARTARRPGERRRAPRRRRRARRRARRPRAYDRDGPAADLPVRRHRARQRHARPRRAGRGRVGGTAARPGRRLRLGAGGRPRHAGGGAGRDPVRRTAAAPGPGPRPRTPAPPADPRRRDLQRGSAGRGAHPQRPARRGGDRGRRGVPQGDDRARRRGHLSRTRPGRRPGPARGAARTLRGVPQPRHRLRTGRGRRERRGARVTAVDTKTEEGAEAGTNRRGGPGIGTGRTSGLATLRTGLRLTPEFHRGIGVTLALALVATVGRVVVPVAVQQTLDRGLSSPGGPDIGFIRTAVLVCGAAVLITAVAAYRMNVRLYQTSESGLAALRVRAFRHVHDLSMLTQSAERRGGLVSRVTTDVDQISQFMQYGGLMIIIAGGQLVVASVLMLIYSWPLALLVWVVFLPLAFTLRHFQRWLSRAYGAVREQVGEMLSAVGESVVGAAVIRAYGAEERTARRIDASVDSYRDAQTRAQTLVAATFPSTELVAALATAAVVVAGTVMGVGGHLTAGRLVAFLFLVTLFVSPMQVATEVLTDAQNAIAGWRRVLDVLDTEPDVADPGEDGVELPRGAIEVAFEDVSFAYPGGPTVLHEVSARIAPRARVAIVGETGSGKTTFAKLLTRLMDPTSGRVRIDGVPLPEVRFSSLRERIVMVPQDGYLFDATLADNIRYGRPGATDEDVRLALTELGLADWLEGLPDGLASAVGQRGESLSAGERQLVALARAYLADPDLLVLDEATSAVDPATEVRLQRALEGITRGRTAISIAHRLSTAEAADEVIVFDQGRIVQRGSHAELAERPGRYAELYASWAAQLRS
ncbi:ABC transporter transmembrane domain-containing protein [Actinoallomurus acaciae]|uniref:ABC transporter transmembrane domain-containing protein n=1 Tax=Actinoallomurus acaciae TaxID=502577 RepID=A0ABV5YV83_9ACTN